MKQNVTRIGYYVRLRHPDGTLEEFVTTRANLHKQHGYWDFLNDLTGERRTVNVKHTAEVQVQRLCQGQEDLVGMTHDPEDPDPVRLEDIV